MKQLLYLQEALLALRTNKLRTFLTMLGIVVGVAAFITMLSVGAGAQARITSQIGSLGSNLLMVIPESDSRNSGPNGEEGRPAITHARRVARLPEHRKHAGSRGAPHFRK